MTHRTVRTRRIRGGSARFAGLAVSLALLLLGAIACAPKPLQAIYYYKAGTPGVEQRLADFQALAKEFSGKVVVRTVEATTEEAQRDLAHIEIGTSGIAVRNGNSIMIFKQGETYFSIPRVREAIQQELEHPSR